MAKKISKRTPSGLTGVYRHHDKWRASVRIDGKLSHIGRFDSKLEAASARLKFLLKGRGDE